MGDSVNEDALEVIYVQAEESTFFVPAEDVCTFIVPPDNDVIYVTRGDDVASTA